jgi:hypothetical protein
MYEEKGVGEAVNVLESWGRQVLSLIASTILLPFNFIGALLNL